MSFKVKGNTITLTRGDSFAATVGIFYPDGREYTPKRGDQIRFAMKKSVGDKEPLIVKEIPIQTKRLVLEPEDTKPLSFGTYVYDIQLTKANGEVDTFITKSNLVLTEEVY